MNSHCFQCGLKFEREQGYFVGAIYINYAATVAIAVPGFFILDTYHPHDDSTTAHDLGPVLGDLPAVVFPPFEEPLAGAGSSVQPSQESLPRAAPKTS